jgi:hypothetical protein
MLMEAGLVDPERSAVHPVNWYPGDGVAVSDTTVPESYCVAFGDFATVPFVVFTVSANFLIAKFAVTLFAPVMLMEAGLVVPERSPVHPVN